MPKKEEVNDEIRRLQRLPGGYSLKVDGLRAILVKDIIYYEQPEPGDVVQLFILPDGRFLLSKSMAAYDSDQYIIERVTPSYIYFNNEVEVGEVS